MHRLRIEMMGMQGPDNREYYQEISIHVYSYTCTYVFMYIYIYM
jgi:hypothetical protein